MRFPSARFTLPFLAMGLIMGLAPAVDAQAQQLLLREGDRILNTPQERIRSIHRAWINDTGAWLAFIFSDRPDRSRDALLLEQGLVFQREGDLLAPLGQGEIQDWWDADLNDRGEIVVSTHARHTGTSGYNKAIFLRDQLVARGGHSVDDPRVPAQVQFRYFYKVGIDEEGRIYTAAALNDPTVAGTTDYHGVIRFTPSDSSPGSFDTEVLLWEGDPIPGLAQTLMPKGLNALTAAFNNAGDLMYTARVDTQTLAAAIVLNDALLARSGTPSPIPGRNYEDLYSSCLDVNDFGEHVFDAGLSGDTSSNAFIQKNQDVLVQTGDVLPALAPDRVVGFLGGVRITNGADVYWSAELDGNPARDRVHMRNGEVILREGDLLGTDVIGWWVSSWNVSDNGRFWLAVVDLSSGDEALLLTDFGAVVPFFGCGGNQGELRLADGLAVTGGALTFEMDAAQAVGATPLLYFSTRTVALTPCGPTGAFGEQLIHLAAGNPVRRLVGQPWNGSAVCLSTGLPPDPSLIDYRIYAQGLFVDPGGPVPLRATNGLEIEVGAP